MSADLLIESSEFEPPAELAGLRRKAWAVGALGVAATAAGAFVDWPQALRSWLVAWLLWLGIALGAFAVMLLHHLSRGGWGLMVRRPLEAASRTIPFLGVLFLPIALDLGAVYKWARPEAADDPLIAVKAAYLDPAFFLVRFVLYFAIWTLGAWLVTRASARQDRAGGDPKLFRRLQKLSGPFLGLYALAATFAAVDWVMSLDPHWYSSIYGVYFIGGHGVSAFVFIVLVSLWLSKRPPMDAAFRPVHFQDYGKLMLAFVMLWAYFAVSQLLIIWSGNLAEEVTWYLERFEGAWLVLALALAFLHFALPFLLLLSRDLKRDVGRLAVVALLLLVMRWVDLHWQVAPTFHHGGAFHWTDLAAVVGIGGLWTGLFLTFLARRPLLPVGDPYLPEALGRE